MQKKLILLCGFVVILGLLQGSAATGCTSGVSNSPFMLVQCPYTVKTCDDMSNSSNLPRIYNCTFNSGLAPVYVLIGLIPLMVYFPLLILFNFNLASGPAQSFIFFVQALPAAIPLDQPFYASYTVCGGFISSLLAMQNPITDLIFPRRLPYLVLHYCKLVAVFIVVPVTLLLVKCIACPCTTCCLPWAKLRRSVRHFREKRAQKGTVLNGLCSIAILTYGFVIQQSLTVLQPAKCSDGVETCAYYCNEWKYMSMPYSQYLAAVIVALISLVLVLPLPLLLLYYPCVPALMQRTTKRSSPLISCHKLAPVFDVFQSAYKPKLRFFAAFPLLYRFVIWIMFAGLSADVTKGGRQATITFVFILILAIHSVIQPYSKPRHNYIETLYLVNLVIISVKSMFSLQGSSKVDCSPTLETLIALSFLPTCLASLPILIGTWYLLRKHNCSKRCGSACCKRVNRNQRELAQDEDLPVEPSATAVYIDIAEVERLNQD